MRSFFFREFFEKFCKWYTNSGALIDEVVGNTGYEFSIILPRGTRICNFCEKLQFRFDIISVSKPTHKNEINS